MNNKKIWNAYKRWADRTKARTVGDLYTAFKAGYKIGVRENTDQSWDNYERAMKRETKKGNTRRKKVW